MSEPVRFLYRGVVHEVVDAPPTQTILQHLREDLRCSGTKEGCAEGDCGACMVVLGQLQHGKLELKAVNSCIQLMPTLDGKALFSVEDLQQADGSLHPVQQAMVECHGSQCGFCTPGFVMSLWGMYLEQGVDQGGKQPQRRAIDDALSGNLCRCTGYRPIIDAAKRMGQLAQVDLDRTALALQLLPLQRATMSTYSAHGQQFHSPRTIEELVQVRAAHPDACLLAGATDVGLWVTKQLRALGDIIYLGQVAALKKVVEADGMLDIGAAVTLNDAYAALCRHYPCELSDLWQRFASLPIRNVGTLGGNLANGSPIGDSMPWLIALGADIVLRGSVGRRVMPLDQFYLDHRKNALQPGEFVEAVRVPLPRAGLQFRTYKLAKRYDQDISAVCAGFALTLGDGIIKTARIAYGGMAAIPKRASMTEQRLQDQPWSEDTLTAAMATLERDYAPLSDMRASGAYRMKAAQNLLRRFWLETRPDAPLSNDAVNVFAWERA